MIVIYIGVPLWIISALIAWFMKPAKDSWERIERNWRVIYVNLIFAFGFQVANIILMLFFWS